MPQVQVPGSDVRYDLVTFDAQGRERTDDPDGLMSRRVLETLTREPVTDVFLISHGWKGDVPEAKDQYNRWIGAMGTCAADWERARRKRPGFHPLLIGLHWPSLPWGDEEFGGGEGSFAAPISGASPAASPTGDDFVERYAARLADTPAARVALQTIFAAALADVAPPSLPPAVRDAYEILDREAGMPSAGPAGAPDADREPFDPERAYQAAEDEMVSFGGFSLGGLLSPLRQLSFWKMKDRARRFGESGGFQLLCDLQRAAPVERGVRFHLMGHSFGCIVVSATVAGPGGCGQLVRPVHSVALIQGALSLWSYASEIPCAGGQPGYFHAIIADRRVAGPIITSQSEYDTAVGRWYPLAAGAARQVSFAPGELPKYGALGSYGVRGTGPTVADLALRPADAAYGFEPGQVYNLESSAVICEGGGASGAHSDIAKPEVAHAVWEAALT